MDCGEYDLPEAVILNNDNLTVDGEIHLRSDLYVYVHRQDRSLYYSIPSGHLRIEIV